MSLAPTPKEELPYILLPVEEMPTWVSVVYYITYLKARHCFAFNSETSHFIRSISQPKGCQWQHTSSFGYVAQASYLLKFVY